MIQTPPKANDARPQNPRLAAALIAVAGAFVALTTLFAKALTSDQFGPALNPLQVTHGRFIFALIALSSCALILRPKFGPIHWGLHILRTSSGALGVTLMFASVAFIPLADATAISFLNPVFGMIFAVLLLREKTGPVRWLAAAIALAGAMILLRPTPQSFEPAALLALGAAVILGFELIVIKRLSGRESPFQILLVNNFLGVIVSSVAVIAVWQTPTLSQWALMAGVGFAMAVAQACYVNAMARADASFVAPFSYGTLIFAALYDSLFYKVIPDWITVLGASIIVAGAVLLAIREGRRKT